MSAVRARVGRLAAALTVGLIAVAASACGSSSGPKASPAAAPKLAVATPTTVRKLNPSYDAGETVTITATGFEPKELIATVNVPLTFVNKTKRVQHVLFEHLHAADGQLLSSGAIAPGQHWSYTPDSWGSATYHSIDQPELRGQIQIQPPAEP